MSSNLRHRVLQRLGYCFVSTPYIQPPLTKEEACHDLILLVHERYVENSYMPASAIFRFVNDFARSIYGFDDSQFSQKDFMVMLKSQLPKDGWVKVKRDMPWKLN
ncbi:uncharacterized protein LOC135119949 [Zophobas morio]|uniref:uncharacterized protein LOC135119949 n=1 Tax=Zophobas morio TaxID=2755281 RepID=UPI0030836C69